MADAYGAYTKVFKAFCDEKRLRIIDLLRSGEKCACVLLDQLDIGQSGLSYHMRILVESGIVYSRPEGKWIHYSISDEGCARAADLLLQLTAPAPAQESCCGKCLNAMDP